MVILATLILAGASIAFTLIQSPTYEAESRVLISEKDTGAALLGTVLPDLSSQPERALLTEVQLVQVRPVAEATVRKLGLKQSPDALLKRVKVTAIGQTNVISISAKASTPEAATEIANAMAEQYVDASKQRKRASIKDAADEVEVRLEQARSEILDLARKIQDSGGTDELRAELQILTGTYTSLAEKLEQLRINERLESGSGAVVEQAVVNPIPIAPRPLRNTALGIIVGVLVGIGLAFLYDYLDDTIKSTEEAERAYGAPVLGTIPVDRIEKGKKRQLAIWTASGSSTAESYRILRNSMDFINFEHKLQTVLVTSAAPAEGKSTVASNLAAALAQAGKKVALVSVDFRRPTTDQFFDVHNSIGLSDVLLGTHSLKSALQRTGDDQLLVLTAGKMPPNPSELLGSTKMHEVIESIEEWADWVIMDGPPLLAVSDPAAAARWADGVLMVTKAGESTRESARRTKELLGKVGAQTIGVVAWGLEEGRGGYGYGYNTYAGGYYYYASYYGTPSYADGKARVVGSGEDEWEKPRASAGRRFARVLGNVLSGLLAFLAILAVAAVAAYFLDQFFGWGLVRTVTQLIPWLGK
jgi:capsular exopolysaccharide synthesis family protein